MTGELPLGEKPLSIPPLEPFSCACSLLCPLSSVVWTHRIPCCWHCSRSHLNCGYAHSWPRDSEVLFSPGHWCTSTEVRSQDCSDCVPEPAVGAVEAAHTLAWPNPCSICPQSLQQLKPPHPSCRSTCCPFRCLQVLNLGSCQWGCNPEVHTEARRFQLYFLVTWPFGLRCGFSTSSVCVSPITVCSGGSLGTQAHQARRNRSSDRGERATQAGGCWDSDWKVKTH